MVHCSEVTSELGIIVTVGTVYIRSARTCTHTHTHTLPSRCILYVTLMDFELLVALLFLFQASNEIDPSYLGLTALYSEIHPTISHIIHYGVNMIAPVYKLQVGSTHTRACARTHTHTHTDHR